MCTSAPAHDDLTGEINKLWDASISPQTARTYQTAIDNFLRFVANSKFVYQGKLPIVNEEFLMRFAVYCHKALQLTYSTIKLYLAGIRFHYVKAGLQNPLVNNERLEYIFRGIRRSQTMYWYNGDREKRFPITFDILVKITKLLDKGLFSPYTDKMMSTVCQMAFFAFLRCGEFTVRNKTGKDDCLLFKDLSISKDHSFYTLHLTKSKKIHSD